MKTLYDKLWEEHHVTQLGSGESLLYIDRHYLHEVTSPQAFEGLAKKNLKPWRLGAKFQKHIIIDPQLEVMILIKIK